MSPTELQRIADYMMPAFPASPSDLGCFFGTRHGVPEFCVPPERRHEHEVFRSRVLGEFDKIPRYLEQGYLHEIGDVPVSPAAP